MIPALDPATGWLPLGRHPCTQGEIEAAFVTAPEFSTSPTRPQIWRDWLTGLQVLQRAVLVHGAWLGGSFTTSKVDPEDLDVTFLINGEDMRGRTPQEQTVITLFGSSQVKALGLRLDTYAIAWEGVPLPWQHAAQIHDAYFWARGCWDDWWQRIRVGPQSSPPTLADAPPRRGYLEVSLSDYP